jgi:hypothetical protein
MPGILAPTRFEYDVVVDIRRIAGHALVISYLAILVLGAVHSWRRFDPVPFGRVTIFFYGMLAPYQGYSETSEGYLAEGYANGTWTEIDLAPYYPVLPGERSMREWHTYANWAQFPSAEAAHRAYAQKLLELEAAAGRTYEHVRLSWIQWRPAEESFRGPAARPDKSRILVIVP